MPVSDLEMSASPGLIVLKRKRLALIFFIPLSLLILFGFIKYIGVPRLVDPSKLIPVEPWMVGEALVFSVPLFFFGYFIVARLSGERYLLGSYSLFFVLRLLMAFILAFVFFFDDERAFHFAAITRNFGFFLWQPVKAYYNFANVTYEIFGENILMLRMFNVFLGSMLPFFAMDLAKNIFGDERASKRAMLYTGLMPPLIIFSAVALKEIPTAFILILFLRYLTSADKNTVARWTGMLVTGLLLYWLRGVLFVFPCALSAVVYYSFGSRPGRREYKRRGYVQALLVFCLLSLLFLPAFIPSLAKTVNERMADEEVAETQAATSSALIYRYIDVYNPLSPKNQALLFMRGIYSPSPISALSSFNIDGILGAINMATWYVLFPLALICFLEWKRKSGMLACGVIVASLLYIIAIGVTAGANVYRHKMIPMALICVMASGTMTLERKHRWLEYIWWLGALFYTGIWVAFKSF